MSLVHIQELTEQRTRCLLAARVARAFEEKNLMAELVIEAHRYHKEILVHLGALHSRGTVARHHLRRVFSTHAVAMHRDWRNGARTTVPATRRKDRANTCI